MGKLTLGQIVLEFGSDKFGTDIFFGKEIMKSFFGAASRQRVHYDFDWYVFNSFKGYYVFSI